MRRQQAKHSAFGGEVLFHPRRDRSDWVLFRFLRKIKNRKCLDFKKKLKIIKDFFFGIAYQKKTCFS